MPGQELITQADSLRSDTRLSTLFRTKDGKDSAWGTFIIQDKKGHYRFNLEWIG
jgi:hypothetical protein